MALHELFLEGVNRRIRELPRAQFIACRMHAEGLDEKIFERTCEREQRIGVGRVRVVTIGSEHARQPGIARGEIAAK
mgnify:CR=1 FL=1